MMTGDVARAGRGACHGKRSLVSLRISPFDHRPTMLIVRVRRYRCSGYGRVWRQDTNRQRGRGRRSHAPGLELALAGVVVDHLPVTRVARGVVEGHERRGPHGGG